MKKIFFLISMVLILFMSCDDSYNQSSDDIARKQQEQILAQGNAEAGMPAIVNFREKKLLKLIYELRDQSKYVTYTYLYSDMQGKFTYIGQSIGYPIPYATQYTNPSKFDQTVLPPLNAGGNVGHTYVKGELPQADPNGLFSPTSANGTWVAITDPKGNVVPFYCEPNVVTLPFKLPTYDLLFVPPNY